MTLYKIKVAEFLRPFYVMGIDPTDAVLTLQARWQSNWARFTYPESIETVATNDRLKGSTDRSPPIPREGVGGTTPQLHPEAGGYD